MIQTHTPVNKVKIGAILQNLLTTTDHLEDQSCL